MANSQDIVQEHFANIISGARGAAGHEHGHAASPCGSDASVSKGRGPRFPLTTKGCDHETPSHTSSEAVFWSDSPEAQGGVLGLRQIAATAESRGFSTCGGRHTCSSLARMATNERAFSATARKRASCGCVGSRRRPITNASSGLVTSISSTSANITSTCRGHCCRKSGHPCTVVPVMFGKPLLNNAMRFNHLQLQK